MTRERFDGRVNETIGAQLGLGFLPPSQIPYFFGLFALFMPYIYFHLLEGLLLFLLVYATWWVLTGNEPTRLFEQLYVPRRWLSQNLAVEVDRAGVPVPEQKRQRVVRMKVSGKPKTYHYIEPEYHLLTHGEVRLETRTAGYYLLRRGMQLMFIFAWEVGGKDPSMTSEQAFGILNAINDGLQAIPNGVDLKIYQDISSGSQEYLRQQANLIRNGNIDRLSTELVKSRAHRAREMDANGELQNNRIFVYAKYRVPLGAQYAVTRNWFEEFLFRLQPVIGAMTPGVEVSAQKWDAVIRYAFRYCYERVDSVLSSGFGLKLQTLGAQAMYERDYADLHESPAYAVPHLLITDEERTYPVINSGIHVRSALFEPEAGLYTTPIPGRSVLKFPSRTRRQYAGFVELGRVKGYPKESGSISRGAMRFLWRVLAAEQRPVHNCRVICELTKDRSGLDVHSADRIISNSIKREALAAKRQTVDVIAMRRRESAIEARDQLEEN
ncbi:MAG TPA: hypothetical protein V6D19_05015, partial [Stenomitos sp.]